MKDKLILIGGGGHCASCIDVIEQEGKFKIDGIIDKRENVGLSLLGYKYIGTDDEISCLIKQDYEFLITLGQIKSPKLRMKLFYSLSVNNAKIATIISPRSYVSKYAKVGVGSIVMHDVLINAYAQVGLNCIINTKALIEHSAIIEDHCHISTSSTVNGDCLIKEGSFIGSNSVCQEGAESEPMGFLSAGKLLKRKDC